MVAILITGEKVNGSNGKALVGIEKSIVAVESKWLKYSPLAAMESQVLLWK
jgi:hypothetical protein